MGWRPCCGRATTFFTLNQALRDDVCSPSMFVLMHSRGLYSAAGTASGSGMNDIIDPVMASLTFVRPRRPNEIAHLGEEKAVASRMAYIRLLNRHDPPSLYSQDVSDELLAKGPALPVMRCLPFKHACQLRSTIKILRISFREGWP